MLAFPKHGHYLRLFLASHPATQLTNSNHTETHIWPPNCLLSDYSSLTAIYFYSDSLFTLTISFPWSNLKITRLGNNSVNSHQLPQTISGVDTKLLRVKLRIGACCQHWNSIRVPLRSKYNVNNKQPDNESTFSIIIPEIPHRYHQDVALSLNDSCSVSPSCVSLGVSTLDDTTS